MNVYYSIIKTYKGIFKKKHAGNVHLLIVPTPKNQFFIFIMIGEVLNEPNTYALQLTGVGPSDYIKNFLEELESEHQETYVNVEKIPVSVVEKNNRFFYKLSKKGKHILSDFNIEIQPEFSTDKQKIWILKGKLNPLHNETVKDKQMKMVGLKKSSIFSGIMNRIKGKKEI